jgi:CRP-like cAMP-binding protein
MLAGGRWMTQAQVVPVNDIRVNVSGAPGMNWNRYRVIGVHPEGSYFGEHSCILGEERVATVVAATFSEVQSLSRRCLEKMIHQWPELTQEILSLLDGCEHGMRITFR